MMSRKACRPLLGFCVFFLIVKDDDEWGGSLRNKKKRLMYIYLPQIIALVIFWKSV